MSKGDEKSLNTTQTWSRPSALSKTKKYQRFSVVYQPEQALETLLEPKTLELSEIDSLVIGRTGGDADFQITEKRASRKHAQLVRVPGYGVLQLSDLGSKNRTFVNGSALSLEPHSLQHNDIIRIGETLMVFSELELASQSQVRSVKRAAPVALGRAYELADKAAQSNLPVLVEGPTGSGKELMAKRLHDRSGRAGEFVAVNCATFTKELIASELFGHVKGAFSGAVGHRKGVFQKAHEGTLFLDEIAELPMDQQPSLLRALQEGEVTPVGSDQSVSVDVRVVAATHKHLATLVEQGAFRQDLQGRLAGIEIEIPGLNARKDEILTLFASFLGEAAQKLNSETAEALLLYDWPKNVRELQHTAHRVSLFLSDTEELTLHLLPPQIREALPTSTEPVAKVNVAKLTKEEVEAALRQENGNIKLVAQRLGIARGTLYRHMDRLGISASQFRGEEE